MKRIVSDTRGMQLVEFALVLPLLLLLLLGIIEFGFVLYNQAAITNASREGARWAATYYLNPLNVSGLQPTCSQIGSYINNQVDIDAELINFTSTTTSVKGCCGSGCTPSLSWPSTNNGTDGYESDGGRLGDQNSVTVQYQHHFLIFGNIISLIDGSGGSYSGLTLTATTSMRDYLQN